MPRHRLAACLVVLALILSGPFAHADDSGVFDDLASRFRWYIQLPIAVLGVAGILANSRRATTVTRWYAAIGGILNLAVGGLGLFASDGGDAWSWLSALIGVGAMVVLIAVRRSEHPDRWQDR